VVVEGVVILVAGGDTAWVGLTREGPEPPGVPGPQDLDLSPARHLDSGPEPVVPTARERFGQAVTALLADDPGSEAARQHGIEAAAALLAAATTGDPGLGQILRPDPGDASPVTCTVACYQIGDLSPTTLKDFADPREAVRAVSHCEELAHVAAELLASTASGLRWTVVVRTGDLVRFQPLTEGAGSNDLSAASLDAAENRWAAQLPRWVAEAQPTHSWQRHQGGQAPPLELGVAMGQVLEAVQGVGRRIEDLPTARELLDRLNTLEQRMVEMQLQLEVHALTSARAPHAGFGPIDAEVTDRPLLRPALARGSVGPRRLLGQRMADVLTRAAGRGLAAARHQAPPVPATDLGKDGRGPG
jgi:hypothetical protein